MNTNGKERVENEMEFFPDWQDKISDIEVILREDNCLTMIFIDASGLSKIESYYGKIKYNEVLNRLKEILQELKGNQIRKDDILATNYKKGNLFFIFLSQKRDKHRFHVSDFENISQRLYDHINQNIAKTLDPLFRERMRIHVGYSIGVRNPLIGTEHLINRMIEEAREVSKYMEFRAYMTNKEKLQELILQEDLRVFYQPIVDLSIMKTIGFEALARGPLGTRFESPLMLFGTAEETGLMFELDRLCRKKAFYYARGLDENKKLFINILPVTIRDPEFKGKKLDFFLEDLGVSPSNVVFEVSEQQAIENFAIFKEESKKYSDLGFSIAIDDAGTGYSNFQALVELKLQYIKLDISLIKGVDQNEIKQQIVRSMINIGKTIQAAIIAEGVETVNELKTLIDLGINYAQGFLFARPAYPFPEIIIPEIGKKKK